MNNAEFDEMVKSKSLIAISMLLLSLIEIAVSVAIVMSREGLICGYQMQYQKSNWNSVTENQWLGKRNKDMQFLFLNGV